MRPIYSLKLVGCGYGLFLQHSCSLPTVRDGMLHRYTPDFGANFTSVVLQEILQSVANEQQIQPLIFEKIKLTTEYCTV